MNLFCCEEVCNEGIDETTFYPRRSSYKFNNYSSQSTDSQSSPQKFVLLNHSGGNSSNIHHHQQIVNIVRPTTMSPTKVSMSHSTYCIYLIK